jgi:hypothetical protein
MSDEDLMAQSADVGDYLLQTDWQALNKRGGLGRTDAFASLQQPSWEWAR